MNDLLRKIGETERQLATLRDAARILGVTVSEPEPVSAKLRAAATAVADTRHWTQRPENAGKLAAMHKRAVATRRKLGKHKG